MKRKRGELGKNERRRRRPNRGATEMGMMMSMVTSKYELQNVS